MSGNEVVTLVRHYSRPVYVIELSAIAPGDLMNVSTTEVPYWAVVTGVGIHCDDDEAGATCEGGCDGVVFFDAADELPYHVTGADEVRVRFLAAVTAAEIEAENTAHMELASARFRF